MTKTQQLERLRHYATRYELVAVKGDRTVLVTYTSQKSRDGIYSSAQHRGEALAKLTGTETITFAKKAKDGAEMNGWKINFSGRTQRDAICNGEHPFILDL